MAASVASQAAARGLRTATSKNILLDKLKQQQLELTGSVSADGAKSSRAVLQLSPGYLPHYRRRWRTMSTWLSPRRWLNLQEYQSKKLMQESGVAVQRFYVADTAPEALEAAKKLRHMYVKGTVQSVWLSECERASGRKLMVNSSGAEEKVSRDRGHLRMSLEVLSMSESQVDLSSNEHSAVMQVVIGGGGSDSKGDARLWEVLPIVVQSFLGLRMLVVAINKERYQCNCIRAYDAKEIVLKAQILAGGRGKGVFDSGLKGGVHLTKDPVVVGELANKMLGFNLTTKQTPKDGVKVKTVMVAEALDISRETYFAILMDRSCNGPVMVGSPQGGMDIEEVAANTPELIFKEAIDIFEGVQDDQALRMAANLGFKGPLQTQAADQIKRLYDLFLKVDATQVEVNPLGETPEGQVVCFDAKINFDDNAEFRQKAVFAMDDMTEVDPTEMQAAKWDLKYIGLDGNIACFVNGAGLAMATCDIIDLHGGKPANFLDLGGGVQERQVYEAFKLLTADPKESALFTKRQRQCRTRLSNTIISVNIYYCQRRIQMDKRFALEKLRGTVNEGGRLDYNLAPTYPDLIGPTGGESISVSCSFCEKVDIQDIFGLQRNCKMASLQVQLVSVLQNLQVEAILVNIFGGIVNCAIIANGITKACRELELKVPLVVRLEGTNVQEAKRILNESGLPITAADNLDDAAKKAVAAIKK
ncbi:hypothetical protein PAMP_017775 [Pampus punctatissimus]